MMFRFFDGHRGPGNADEATCEATGTFADGVFPVSLRKAQPDEMALRMRASYTRDLLAAQRLAADQAPVFH
jgi:hypothetical protein